MTHERFTGGWSARGVSTKCMSCRKRRAVRDRLCRVCLLDARCYVPEGSSGPVIALSDRRNVPRGTSRQRVEHDLGELLIDLGERLRERALTRRGRP